MPIIIVASELNPLDLFGLAWFCALLREQFGRLDWGPGLVPRLTIAFVAYFGTGLLIRETDRHRKEALQHAQQLADEIKRRKTVEEQLRGLIHSMPAAILTLSAGGEVLLANDAAHQLLGCEPESLIGKLIDDYLPDMARLRRATRAGRVVRTMIEGTGYRRSGQAFLAQVWVSSYGPHPATGFAAVVFDATEQLRAREEVGLHSLTASARVVLGAFWHEIRNLCSAMRVLVTSLMHRPGVAEAQEVEGLKSLVEGLEKLAYAELHPDSDSSDTASLRAALDHLRIVIEPSFQEKHIALKWCIEDKLPLVRADHHGLLQVFLNIARNASRALEQCERREFTVTATTDDGRVQIRFQNSGPPIANPENLFTPWISGSSERGLGLYVSRAILRSFGGHLSYEPVSRGCCFAVTLERSDLWYIYNREPEPEEDPRVAR
ncbi:MAG TPA: ATP-binding protein [Bryobacteraceae bacterium]|nr:ATP-binding protein [Bryobacteraceae bacterium]